jgi:hypothetical protein
MDAARAEGYRAMQFNLVVATNASAIHLYATLGLRIIACEPEAFRLHGERTSTRTSSTACSSAAHHHGTAAQARRIPSARSNPSSETDSARIWTFLILPVTVIGNSSTSLT